MHYIEWQLQGSRQWVEESSIVTDLGTRRRPAPPNGPQTRARKPEPKKMKKEKEENRNNNDKKPAAKRVSKLKQRSTQKEKGTDIVKVCPPGPWAYEIKKLAKEPKVLQNRLPDVDDIGYIGNEVYVVKGGFSAFYNQFEHIPHLTEVRHDWTGDRRYVYTDASTLNPQEGQVMPHVVRDDEDMEADRIEPEFVGSHGATRRLTSTARTPASAEHHNLTCSPQIMAALAHRLQKRAKHGRIFRDRQPTDGRTVTYQGRTYIVLGYSLFFGRFRHCTDQMELHCTTRRERVYVPRECLKEDNV